MRNLEEFNGRFSKEICFIIGSGPSLVDFDPNILRDRLTISVNSGFLAAPNSKFFLSDDENVCRWSYFNNELMTADATVLLYEDKLEHEAMKFGSRAVLFRHRKGYHITPRYKHEVYENRLFEARTSVGTAVHVAFIAGCREIVLLGIDCCRVSGKRYFWQFWDRPPTRSDSVPVDYYRKIKSDTIETDSDLVDILRYWKKLYHSVRGKCKIYNASPISLVDVFPTIKLSDLV